MKSRKKTQKKSAELRKKYQEDLQEDLIKTISENNSDEKPEGEQQQALHKVQRQMMSANRKLRKKLAKQHKHLVGDMIPKYSKEQAEVLSKNVQVFEMTPEDKKKYFKRYK